MVPVKTLDLSAGRAAVNESAISALYVLKGGPYFGVEGIDPWDEDRDARKYQGPNPVIAHPPCERWGRYWGGGPMLQGKPGQKIKGNDGGCFAHALWAVRSFGGVLEHPEASHAWNWFGLRKPPRSGGWIMADYHGGWTCCVAQGRYGHRAQKLTWLYASGIKYPQLDWGLCPNKQKIEDGFHSKEERARLVRTGICKRLSKRQRAETPQAFKELLIALVKGARP